MGWLSEGPALEIVTGRDLYAVLPIPRAQWALPTGALVL